MSAEEERKGPCATNDNGSPSGELLDPRRPDHRHVELELALPVTAKRLDLGRQAVDLHRRDRGFAGSSLDRKITQRVRHSPDENRLSM